MNAEIETDDVTDREVLEASLRFNTIVFGAIVGLFAGAALLVLGIAAHYDRPHTGLAVALMGIFLPGYAASGAGPMIGFLWGLVIGAFMGAVVYRAHSRRVLPRIDAMMIAGHEAGELPQAVLKLDGASLALGVGALGALGLITTTNILVARGTAAQSIHARLLGEILPGYTVSVAGSLIGAAELFVVLYVLTRLFAAIYNALAGLRQR
jgi:hypothetical protein